MPTRPPPPTALVTRRALGGGLVGAAAALAVAGCDVDVPDNGPTGGDDDAGTSPDEALVREALTLCEQARDEVGAVAAGPGLRPVLAPVLAMHAAHADALRAAVADGASGSPSTQTSATRAPLTRGAASSRVGEVEQHTHDRLVALAQRAESGRLARLFASMAAAVSQQRAVLRRG